MQSIGQNLNLIYKLNSKKLNSFPTIKVIFRPITLHFHDWMAQFKNNDHFDYKSPNVVNTWTIKAQNRVLNRPNKCAPSYISQKNRILSCFGFVEEEDRRGLYKFSLNETGIGIRDKYFKNKDFLNKNKLPSYVIDAFHNKILNTNLQNINVGTNLVIRSLRMIANEGFFYTSSSSLKDAPDIIKSFCYEYFNHTGSSPDLLNWVLGTIEDIDIVKKSRINSKSLLDISSSDSNKITVYEVTRKGIELINSLKILSEKILPFETVNQNFVEVSSNNSGQNINDRRNRLITPSSFAPRKLSNNTFDKNLKSPNLSSRGRANPEITQKLRTQSNMRHQTALHHAKQFIFLNKKQPFDIPQNVDLYFKDKDVFHVFEIKSWVPSNLHSQFRDGNVKLLEYTFQNKSTHFKKGECNMHLLFHNNPTNYFRPYWIPFMKSLNINLCFMQDKKIVWHKDFINNDPFLKN